MVFDDMLTTGTHFKVMKEVLMQNSGCMDIRGMFIARRQIPNPFEDFDVDDWLNI